MSGSNTLTIAAPPTTEEVAVDLIAWMAGQSGVVTDYNPGSQFRTNAEALGSVLDMQGIISQALGYQALLYAAFSAFNVFPLNAVPAVGVVTFSTGTDASPPVATQGVSITAGTIVATVGGTQFQTTATVTLVQGTTSVDAPIQALTAGINGNVAAGTIVQLISGLGYPLFVSNASATASGSDSETPAQTLARFTATVAATGLSTPVAVANACIGVTAAGTAETVMYSTVYEPWIALGLSGTAGFQVYLDNGAGTASNQLLTAVAAVLDGNRSAGQDGYRPVGVPYGIYAVTPVPSSVVVSGTAVMASLDPVLTSEALAAIKGYFASLQFGDSAELPLLTAAVANSVAGNITGLQVTLLDVSGRAQTFITPAPYRRVILSSANVTFS